MPTPTPTIPVATRPYRRLNCRMTLRSGFARFWRRPPSSPPATRSRTAAKRLRPMIASSGRQPWSNTHRWPFASEDIGGDNLLGQLVARYDSEADAAAAFTYFESLEELCNQNWTSDDELDYSTMYITPISPAAIEGVDRLTATGREIHGPDAVIGFDVYGAQVGDALLLAFATDTNAAKALITTLAQRAQGIDATEPLTLNTPMETLPGFRSVDYWDMARRGSVTGPSDTGDGRSFGAAVAGLGRMVQRCDRRPDR